MFYRLATYLPLLAKVVDPDPQPPRKLAAMRDDHDSFLSCASLEPPDLH